MSEIHPDIVWHKCSCGKRHRKYNPYRKDVIRRVCSKTSRLANMILIPDTKDGVINKVVEPAMGKLMR